MRTKLGAMLIVPSLAFLIVAGAQTRSLAAQATELNEFARQVGIAREITALVHALQQERARTAGEMAAVAAAGGGFDQPQVQAVLEPFQVEVDEANLAFRSAAVPLARGEPAWQTSYARATEALDALTDLRAYATRGLANGSTVEANYTRTIDSLLTLLAQPSPGADRPELTNSMLRNVQIAEVKEVGSRITARLYSAARAGRYEPDDLVELADLRTQREAAIAELRRIASRPQVQRYESVSAQPQFATASRLEETAVRSAGADPVPPEPNAWWTASQDRQNLLRDVESSVLDATVEQANSRSNDLLLQTAAVAAAVLAVLLFGLLTSLFIGRSIARSLRLLRGQALQVAQLELPEALERLREVNVGVPKIDVPPAAVRSMDEVGEVAEAFVAVHRSAVTVAIEQAVMRRNVNAMFVNLARRSQVLVERQLELLDELEREEGDPEQLGNLFKLDHLAARMRRNDDSLLVLAGTEPTRRWQRPVALPAVLLAAIAEIEHYPRVRHEVSGRLYIVGHAVADLVHLLAELLENATLFSPPYTAVEISARAADGDTALIEIADEGLGMSPAALWEANEVLALPTAADVAASERMGLFVVSHLAARQGIGVQLRAADRGIVAVVSLPPGLLAAAPLELTYQSGTTSAPKAVDAGRANGTEPDELFRRLADDQDLPIAGQEPGAGVVRRPPRRTLPVRAEDILTSAGGSRGGPGSGSTWWSPQGLPGGDRSALATPPPTSAAAPAPPAVPVTGGVNASGLPVRVPMAQLPPVNEAAIPVVPASRAEPDPEAVGAVLSRFYGGVRRAESEETTEMAVARSAAASEEERR